MKPAFTLVELLVVIAIIAVLAALLIPTIVRSKQKAQQSKCVNNLHQLGIALQNSVADNQAYPGAALRKVDGAGSVFFQADWIDQLERGLGASKIITNFLLRAFHCRSDASTNFQDSLGLSYG